MQNMISETECDNLAEQPTRSHKWFNNEEIAKILVGVHRNPNWICDCVQRRPISGSILFYNRRVTTTFKQDDYLWKRRRNGMAREDHMKLKVNGLESPDILMIHYLNLLTPEGADKIIEALRNTTHLSREVILEQMKPMWGCPDGCSFPSLEAELNALLDVVQNACPSTSITMLNQKNAVFNLDKYVKHSTSDAPLGLKSSSKIQMNGFATDKSAAAGTAALPDVSSIFSGSNAGFGSNEDQGQDNISSFSLLLSSMCRSNCDSNQLPAYASVSLPVNNGTPRSDCNGYTSNADKLRLNDSFGQKKSKKQRSPDVRRSSLQLSSSSSANKFGFVNGAVPATSELHINMNNNNCDDLNLTLGSFGLLTDSVLNKLNTPLDSPEPLNHSGEDVNAVAVSCQCAGTSLQRVVDQQQADAVVLPNGFTVDNSSTDSLMSMPDASSDPMFNIWLAESATSPSTLQIDDNEHSGNHFNLGLTHDDINQTLQANLSNDKEDHSVSNGMEMGAYDELFNILQPGYWHQAGNSNDILPHRDELSTSRSEYNGKTDADATYAVEKSASNSSVVSDGSNGILLSSDSRISFGGSDQLSNLVQNGTESEDLTDSTVVAVVTDFSPEWSYLEGGSKLLISGPWSSKHVSYSCWFDNAVEVPATLVQNGVLRCYCPPRESAGQVSLQVACNGCLLSSPVYFEYKAKQIGTDDANISPRIASQAMNIPVANDAYSTDALFKSSGGHTPTPNNHSPRVMPGVFFPNPSDEESLRPASVQRTQSQLFTESQAFITAESGSGLRRELTPGPANTAFALPGNDEDGSRPLAFSGAWPSSSSQWQSRSLSIRKQLSLDSQLQLPLAMQNSLSLPTPPPFGGGKSPRSKRASFENIEEFVTKTAAEHQRARLSGSRDTSNLALSSWLGKPLSVEIPMNVSLPDSPTMAEMWNTVTGLKLGDQEGAREQIATLAQQIIDALPERIKAEPATDDFASFRESMEQFEGVFGEPFENYRYIDVGTPTGSPSPVFLQPNSPGPSTSASVAPGMEESLERSPLDTPLSAAELGEFFNASRSPIEKNFQELTLSDREQRELYEAAKIIQNAYRQYKARIRGQEQQKNEAERQAAIVIQSYYRRYKQYCYFKKIHRAAVLIQKHFRNYKAAKHCGSDDVSLRKANCHFSDDSSGDEEEEESRCSAIGRRIGGGDSLSTGASIFDRLVCRAADQQRMELDDEDGSAGEPGNNRGDDFCPSSRYAASKTMPCIRIQITPDELLRWKQHLAAIRIQHAFRGHYMRKRQAAARKIQKFMRESRQKLIKERASTCADEECQRESLRRLQQTGCPHTANE